MSQTPTQHRPDVTYSYPKNSVRLTENQRRIIADKYLKESPNIESWLWGVAKNIALAELLHHPLRESWGLFDGVRVSKKDVRPSDDTPATRTWLFHAGLFSAQEREDNFKRFLQNCEKIINNHGEAGTLVLDWTNRFFELMSRWDFLPNSPTLMNAGRDLQQLSACYVLPVEDSVEGITHALQAQALIHKSGGGTGFSFEKIRPAGDAVKSTSGIASGVISFMKVFDKMTEVVKQGGNRRGANMAILPYWHPEIKDFIRVKNQPGQLENFNLSVSVDDRFFQAVEHGWDYDLINPRTQQPMAQVSAREIFDSIVENAWRSGDPGLVFIDRINESSSNPTPALGKILATNPCGEQPLLPNEPCNLGSLNLSHFVTDQGWEWERLEDSIRLAVRFLDNVIEVNNYPLPEIEIMAKGNRRIGLGVMGWAEALVKLGISYDSEAALKEAGEVMSFINRKALHASEELAKERGVFPNWKGSIFDPESQFYRGETRLPRHAARTTIAPTGTIGLAAGLQGGGIEPFFAIAYTRYTADAIDHIKHGEAPDPKDIYFEINPLFLETARAHQFFGLKDEELWRKIEANHKSVRGIPEIPADIQALFGTAHDVPVDGHVRMQAAFQQATDNAVSKTINLPHTAPQSDVETAFRLAQRLGCKGITVYRDGSRQQQVLNLVSNEKTAKRVRNAAVGLASEYYEIKTGHGPLHVHIDYDDEGPFRVSASIEPVGSEMAGLAALTGVLLTKYLEQGGNLNHVLRNLNSIRGDRPLGLGPNKVNSISHGLSLALRNHLKKHGWLDDSLSGDTDLLSPETPAPHQSEEQNFELWSLAQAGEPCVRCLSPNVTFNSGCSGPLCQDCGYSECH